jgi:hypothetical protein
MESKFRKLVKRLRSAMVSHPDSARFESTENILDKYIMAMPSDQNALDIFKDEWFSKLPDPNLKAGTLLLFDDPRLKWFLDQLGEVENKSALELGPLEAGHTYILEHAGAASILSIEASTRAYLKCLIIKEALQLKRARFLCGNFVEYLRNSKQEFDFCVASGVLYHMTNPIELIALLSRVTGYLYLWTHYCDPESTDYLSSSEADHEGFHHTLYRKPYGETVSTTSFCGGGNPYSNWLTEEDLFNGLKFFGFKEIRIGFDHRDHQHGPSMAIYAAQA